MTLKLITLLCFRTRCRKSHERVVGFLEAIMIYLQKHWALLNTVVERPQAKGKSKPIFPFHGGL